MQKTRTQNTWSKEDAAKVGVLLGGFYSSAAPLPVTTEGYVSQLTDELRSSIEALAKHEQVLTGRLIESSINKAITFIEGHLTLFDARARSGKIIEGHGDLRPEHICLEEKPVIIDCLEFNRDLRIVDPASELMFLNLECERLGSVAAGELIFETYCERTGDDPPEDLLAFYRAYHAAVRAKVAIWHLQDRAVRDVDKWVARARLYLEMAA